MGKVSIPVFDPLGILERMTKDAPVNLYDPIGSAIRKRLGFLESSSPEHHSSESGAKRICPLCGTTLESYPGVSLKARAREHYIIAHKDYTTEEQKEIWRSFYNSLPSSIEDHSM